MTAAASPVECGVCGQRGDQPPGLRLSDYPQLHAVFVDDEAVPPPQQLTCRACGHSWPVPRGSIQVRADSQKRHPSSG